MRFFRIVALLVLAALLLSACGGAAVPTANETTKSGQRFLLALPRLVVDVDESGQASVGGLNMKAINSLTPGLALPDIALNPFYVDWMRNTNVQHIELVSGENGVYVYVNGQQMPSLNWADGALNNLPILLGLADSPAASLVSKLVPVIQRTGLNIVLRFPMQEGVAEIPMRDPSVPPAEVVAAEAGPAQLVSKIDVSYDANGVPSIAGISSRDLAQAGVMLPIELTPQTLAQLKAAGVKEMQLVTGPEGVFITVNGQPLPHFAWSDAQLQNVTGLYEQMNPTSPYIGLAKLFLPELSKMDVDLQLNFAE